MNFAIAAASPTPTSPPASAQDHRKLTEAAQQFEGMLLQEMLKPMREHGFAQQGSDDATSEETGGSDTLSSFGAETMATAIAKSGGLGIAKHIVAQVESEQGQRNQAPPPSLQQSHSKTVTVLKSTQNPPMN